MEELISEGENMDELKLLGKLVIKGDIVTKTGLAIGGSTVGLEIGGIDNPVIRDSTGVPYIPGSSLKGKLRSLLEKAEGTTISSKESSNTPRIHVCKDSSSFAKCPVCRIFGSPGETKFSEPTRIIVRDSYLKKESQQFLQGLTLDTDFTEVKWENTIDRITSAANPRQMERVPAGALFNFEMIFDVLRQEDKELLRYFFKAAELLEKDYLGSSGTRGYGKIVFESINIFWYTTNDFEKGNIDDKQSVNGEYQIIVDILKNFDMIIRQLK
jgi:CRISPR-associated protein Csm3